MLEWKGGPGNLGKVQNYYTDCSYFPVQYDNINNIISLSSYVYPLHIYGVCMDLGIL